MDATDNGKKFPVQGQIQEVNDHLINNIGAGQAMADSRPNADVTLLLAFFSLLKNYLTELVSGEMNNKWTCVATELVFRWKAAFSISLN